MQNTNCSLVSLPNLGLKVIKNTLFSVPKEIDSLIIAFRFFNKLSRDDFDVLLILLHIFLNGKINDGLIYFNTNDILLFRGIKKIKQHSSEPSGYKKEVKNKIISSINNLDKMGIFHKIEYKKYNFAGYFDEMIMKDKRKTKISTKIIQYNHYKKPWHKDIGYFLAFFKYKKAEYATLQIKKILKYIRSDYSFLAPNEVRSRFEDVMDELAQGNVIENWHYQSIDEEFLNCKNWLYYWSLLSIKIDFKTLAYPPCFLNF